MSALIRSQRVSALLYFGGRHSISGLVKKNGVAGAYLVILYDRKTGRPILSTRGSDSGVYSFQYLKDHPYFAVALDDGYPSSEIAAVSDQLVLVS